MARSGGVLILSSRWWWSQMYISEPQFSKREPCLLWVYGGPPRFIKLVYLFDKSRELISSLDPTSWVPFWLVSKMPNSVSIWIWVWDEKGSSDLWPGNRPRTTTCSNPLLRRSNSKQRRCQINKSTIVYKIFEIEILARRAPSLFKHLISCILDTIATTLRCFDKQKTVDFEFGTAETKPQLDKPSILCFLVSKQ